MFKKRDQFYECLKKNGETILYKYLDELSLLNLGVCSKKYYMLINPVLTVMGLDYRKKENGHKMKGQGKKNKNKKKDEEKDERLERDQVFVDVVKSTINKNKEDLRDGGWLRITQVPYRNEYL